MKVFAVLAMTVAAAVARPEGKIDNIPFTTAQARFADVSEAAWEASIVAAQKAADQFDHYSPQALKAANKAAWDAAFQVAYETAGIDYIPYKAPADGPKTDPSAWKLAAKKAWEASIDAAHKGAAPFTPFSPDAFHSANDAAWAASLDAVKGVAATFPNMAKAAAKASVGAPNPLAEDLDGIRPSSLVPTVQSVAQANGPTVTYAAAPGLTYAAAPTMTYAAAPAMTYAAAPAMTYAGYPGITYSGLTTGYSNPNSYAVRIN